MMKLREFLQRRRRKKVILNIRRHMQFFGVDLSHLTDEEIERRFVEAARLIASTGMPASDFARGLQRFGESAPAAMQGFEESRKG